MGELKSAKGCNNTPIEHLRPSIHNARTHSAEQIDKIAKSIKEFGFLNPIIIDATGEIIAGHGRFLAAEKLGLVDVPTILVDHLTEEQKRAYIIADNRMALDAGWDEAMLHAELANLDACDFDLSLTGFTDEEIGDILKFGDSPPISIDNMLQEQKDENELMKCHCPKCGFVFEVKK